MSVVLAVRLTPRAGRDVVDGVDAAGVIRARVAAPPADGAANVALTRLLAKALDVPPSALEIVSGRSGRDKRVRIDQLTVADVLARWPGASLRPG